MIELLIAGAAGGIVMYFIMIYCFMCRIESGSNKNEPAKIFGVNYWFMTQDQIQKAVKSIFLFEKSTAENPTVWCEPVKIEKCCSCGEMKAIIYQGSCKDCLNF